jgi:hypothetical protein
VKEVGEVWEIRTFTVNPKQSTRQIPVLESTASDEPYRRFTGVDSAGDNVIFRRVWRRDPDSGILLQVVSYRKGTFSAVPKSGRDDVLLILLISFATSCMITSILDENDSLKTGLHTQRLSDCMG